MNWLSTTPSEAGSSFQGRFSVGLRWLRTALRPAPVPKALACRISTMNSTRGKTVAPAANRGAYGDRGAVPDAASAVLRVRYWAAISHEALDTGSRPDQRSGWRRQRRAQRGPIAEHHARRDREERGLYSVQIPGLAEGNVDAISAGAEASELAAGQGGQRHHESKPSAVTQV